MITPDRVVRNTCPYCGVGCQVTLHVKGGHIHRAGAPFEAAPNFGMLCVKGRFGTDFTIHPGRLRAPLLRLNRDPPRSAPSEWRAATWEEALDFVADRMASTVRSHGGDALATFACATPAAWPDCSWPSDRAP